METHLLTIVLSTRVEPSPNALVHALQEACERKARLILLGTRGTFRYLQGTEHVNRFNPEQYMAAARAGLLYLEPLRTPLRAFSPALDTASGLPLLMEEYAMAFAKRSHAGPASLQQPQSALLP
jgi:hypothetical protein